MAFKVDKNQVLLYFCNTLSESSSVGRAQPCQGWGREFESRLSLQTKASNYWKLLSFWDIGKIC